MIIQRFCSVNITTITTTIITTITTVILLLFEGFSALQISLPLYLPGMELAMTPTRNDFDKGVEIICKGTVAEENMQILSVWNI